MPTPPYQFIAIARTIARGLRRAGYRPSRRRGADRGRASDLARDRDAGRDGSARTAGRGPIYAFRAAGAVSGTGPRSLIDRRAPAVERLVGIANASGRIIEDPERIARGLVRLAQSHRQLCADFLRDHRDGMDTPAVAKFAARIRMFDRVIASASLALSNLPDDNNDRHAMLRATIDSMAEDTTADLMPQPDPSRE